jgi:transcription elongation factor GreA
MKQVFNITKIGKKELEAELAQLISERKAVAEEVATARDFGDLRENSEYDAARKKQGWAESRIAEIENILQNAEIIGGGEKGKVGLGNSVSLKNLDNGKIVKYTMVGAVEANPLEGKISNESPIGVQLMGKKLGEEVEITTPKGAIKYEITEIA